MPLIDKYIDTALLIMVLALLSFSAAHNLLCYFDCRYLQHSQIMIIIIIISFEVFQLLLLLCIFQLLLMNVFIISHTRKLRLTKPQLPLTLCY